jgi:hypothetical protein
MVTSPDANMNTGVFARFRLKYTVIPDPIVMLVKLKM